MQFNCIELSTIKQEMLKFVKSIISIACKIRNITMANIIIKLLFTVTIML